MEILEKGLNIRKTPEVDVFLFLWWTLICQCGTK